MNWGQFKYIYSICQCTIGSVVTLHIAGWNDIYDYKYFLSLNSTNAMKRFKENSNEIFTITLTLTHFWTAAQKWIKYYQGVNVELLKCLIIIREYPGKYKELTNPMVDLLTIKRFIYVTNFLQHFNLINYINMVTNIFIVEKIGAYTQ